jgi:hypothetical protein
VRRVGGTYWPWADRVGWQVVRFAATWHGSARPDAHRVAMASVRAIRAILAAGVAAGPLAEEGARLALVVVLYRAGGEMARARGQDAGDPAFLEQLRREVHEGLYAAGSSPSRSVLRSLRRGRRFLSPAARVWSLIEGGSLVLELYAAEQERRRAERVVHRLDAWTRRRSDQGAAGRRGTSTWVTSPSPMSPSPL